jgi:hypothetical protein
MSRWKRKIAVALITAIGGIVIVMTMVSGRTINRSDSLTRSTAIPNSLKSANRVEVVVVTVLPTGFEPNEIKRGPGKFLLAVDNRSNLRDLKLRLEDESGNVRHEHRIHGGKLDSREPLDLPTGRYLLKVINQKEWVCRIEIN